MLPLHDILITINNRGFIHDWIYLNFYKCKKTSIYHTWNACYSSQKICHFFAHIRFYYVTNILLSVEMHSYVFFWSYHLYQIINILVCSRRNRLINKMKPDSNTYFHHDWSINYWDILKLCIIEKIYLFLLLDQHKCKTQR